MELPQLRLLIAINALSLQKRFHFYLLNLEFNIMLVRTALIFLVVLIASGLECNATMSHYLSPHSLGKQDEIADALKIVCPQVRVKTTTYSYGKSNYTIYNTTVRCVYNDGRQTADIPNNQTVTVSGGLI